MVPCHVHYQNSSFRTHPSPFLDPSIASAKAPYWGWDFIRAVNRLPCTVRAPWGQAASVQKKRCDWPILATQKAKSGLDTVFGFSFFGLDHFWLSAMAGSRRNSRFFIVFWESWNRSQHDFGYLLLKFPAWGPCLGRPSFANQESQSRRMPPAESLESLAGSQSFHHQLLLMVSTDKARNTSNA